jgi:hypothetical protein
MPQIFGVVNATPNGWGEPPAVGPTGQEAPAANEPIHQ